MMTSETLDSPDVPHPGRDVPTAIARQEASLARQLEWITGVDGKTPIIIGLATAMLAVTAAVSPEPKNLTWGLVPLMALGSLPLVGCLCWCAAATFPRTDGPPGSAIYFGSICKLAHGEFADAIARRTDTEYLADLNSQCHRNAQIAAAKYQAIQRAMIWLLVGTPVWLVANYLLYKG